VDVLSLFVPKIRPCRVLCPSRRKLVKHFFTLDLFGIRSELVNIMARRL
jgi:hypothetical protein